MYGNLNVKALLKWLLLLTALAVWSLAFWMMGAMSAARTLR